MRGRRRQAGVARCLIVPAVVLTLWGGVARGVPSVEWAVEEATLVVRGRVESWEPVPRDEERVPMAVASLRVSEVIKGQVPDEWLRVVTSETALANLLRAQGERSEAVVFVRAETGPTREGGYAGRLTWRDPELRSYGPGWRVPAVCADGRLVRDLESFVRVAREAARYAGQRGYPVVPVTLQLGPPGAGTALPPRAPLGAEQEARRWRFEGVFGTHDGWYLPGIAVPRDARLAALAREWMARADPAARLAGLEAIAEFPLAENVPLVQGLATSDPASELDFAWAWVPDPAGRAQRRYPVRGTAINLLQRWQKPVPEGAHWAEAEVLYRPVRTSAVAVAVIALLAMAAVIRARWRWSFGAMLAAACLPLALGAAAETWHSRRVHTSLSAAGTSADWEVTIAGGRFWVLRVRDEASPHGPMVRTWAPGAPKNLAWYVPYRAQAGKAGWLALSTNWGIMTGAARYPYRAWEASGWLVAGALGAWPAAWGAGRLLGAARRRRRCAAGRCAECGYDLRGSGGSGRCPECGGGVTTPSRRPAASR